MTDHDHDHNHRYEESSDQSSIFLLGIVVGAALTYLFATKTGQKIKKELMRDAMNTLEGIGDEIEEKKEEIEEGVKTKIDSLKEKLEEKKDNIEERLAQVPDQAKEQVAETIREVPPQVEKIQKKGRRFFFSKKPARES